MSTHLNGGSCVDRWKRRVLGGGIASAKALKLEEAE